MDAQQQASQPVAATGNGNGANGRKGGPAASEQKAHPKKTVGCQIIEYQIVCQQGFRQQDARTQGEMPPSRQLRTKTPAAPAHRGGQR